jgi:HSP20 family protein
MTFLTRFERWDPFEELQGLRDRLNRTLRPLGVEGEEIRAGSWSPAADVFETSDALFIKTELPGVSEKDIRIEVENNVLTLTGERQFEKKTDDLEFRRIERSYGTFSRYFNLIGGLDTKNVTAVFDGGVLEIRIPKSEEAKPKSIKVELKKNFSSAA